MKRTLSSGDLQWLDNLAKGSEGLRDVQPPIVVDILAHLRLLNRKLQHLHTEAKVHRKTNPSYGKKYT